MMYTIFDGKGTPIAGIHIRSIDKWYFFHLPLIELCIPFNCSVNELSLKYE